MRIVFCDFETTGLPTDAPLTHPEQPYIVSMGLIVRDGKKLRGKHYMLVQTPVESDEKAFECHGLDQSYLNEVGVPTALAVRLLYNVMTNAELFVAHNTGFDKKIANIAFSRYATVPALPSSLPKYFCTMQKARKFMANERRWSLDAACKRFLDMDERQGFHTSLDDVERCMALFDHFVRLGEGPVGTETKTV